MKGAYPIILEQLEDGYLVNIPDFSISTEGNNLVEAIEMARDAIGLMGIDMEDDGKEIPKPQTNKFTKKETDILTLVDVDFVEYRKKADNKAVKKNCTIPYWMSVEADKIGVNYSRILQDAISQIINANQSQS